MVLMAVSGGCASARDYHVSPRGDDANPGTIQRPWKTIGKVNAAALNPGDRVLFQGGETFAGTIILGREDGGAAGARVEIGSYGEGRAVIHAGDASGLRVDGCSHLLVRELEFVGSGRKAGNTASGVDVSGGEDIELDHIEVSGFQKSGVSVSGVRHARIAHVYAHENGQAGISSDGGGSGAPRSEDLYIGHCVAENNPGDPTNLTNHSGNGIVVGCVTGCVIEYCEAMNNGWDMPRRGNGPVGIWAWNADHVVIQFCVAHHNKSPGWDGSGFDFDGGVTNSILQYNYSYENAGPGYFLCQYPHAPRWQHNIVRYNISVNDGIENNVSGGCAIEVIGSGTGGMSDAEIYNNTVYNERGAAVGFGGRQVPRVRFRNNVFVTSEEMIRGDWSRARFEGNCYWPIGDGFRVPRSGEEWFESFEEWAEASGQETSGGKVVGMCADPLLTEAGTVPEPGPERLQEMAAYRLETGSPCLGTGVPIEDNGGVDFWRNSLPEEGRPNVGAWQGP